MIALDRSLRTYDLDGHLSVEACNISKAMICPYKGDEIPRFKELGLDPEKIYQLYRDPVELEKAAPTFHLKPLLIVHKAVSADQPAQELNAGAVGEAKWNPPYLTAPIAIWTAEAAALVESGKKEQLSAGYRYDALMSPGMVDGKPFDGRMTNIRANHVALVVEGRCGPDVIVPDHLPPELKMRRPKLIEALKSKGFVAADADLVALDAALEDLDAEDETPEEKEKREKAEAAKDKKAKDGKAKDGKAKDEKDDDDDKDDKKAKDKKAKDGDVNHLKDFDSNKAKDEKTVTLDEMNAAIKASNDATVARVEALHVARKAVEPICGVVAMDSADEVYGFALDHLKIARKGVHPSAYPTLIAMAKERRAPVRIATDAALATGDRVVSIWPIAASARR